MNNIKSDKNIKNLRRMDLVVANRLIMTVYENTMEKKTNIARNSKMGYDKCVRYLTVLEMMDFVKKDLDNKFELISLTESGIKYAHKIMKK